MIFPFPEYGHLNPTLKLARGLQQAGHRVCYIGFAEFEEYVLSQGLEFIPILERASSGEPPARMQRNNVSDILSALEAADRAFSDQFRQIESELDRITRETNPDLLIVDFLLGGLAYKAANESGITSVLLSASLFEMPMLGKPAYDPHYLQLPILVLCPEEFDFRNTEKKPNRYYIEPSIDLQRKELYSFPWHELDDSKPLIYCSMGSESHLYEDSTNLFRAIIEAMRERPDWQLVLAVGPYLKTSDFQSVPDNVVIVNWAPQLEMLERASIMINHGGLGAVKECILFGVPMIAFPCKWDQPFNAARVVAHGLGVRGSINKVTAGQIHRLIETVAGNPSFKSRIDAMSKVFNEIENSGKGVKILERIISDFQDTRNEMIPSATVASSFQSNEIEN
jgi:UDP:flavonoid glycosyltransferase YjiC (YdhE family)